MLLQSGAVYGLGGRLALALKDFDGWRLVALDGDGQPLKPVLAFAIDDQVAGETEATVLVQDKGRFYEADVVTFDADRLELVADDRATLFAPAGADLVAIWDT